MRAIFHHEPLLLVGVLTLLGFYAGNVARWARLPSLIGFMVLGVLAGPSVAGLLDQQNLDHFAFITNIGLGMVAFGIGAELRLRELAKLGSGIVSIIFAESFAAFLTVLAAVYLVTRNLPLALLFAGVAPASAPAGTVAVIQEYKAKGNLTRALYAVVGFDDGLAILIFGFAAATAKVLLQNSLGVEGVTTGFFAAMQAPSIEVVGSLVTGTVMGFLLCVLAARARSSREVLIITLGVVFITTGISEAFHFSLILTNMLVGFVLSNTRREAFVHRVTTPLQELMPFMFVLFFCLAGAHLKLAELPALGGVGLVYILARSAGLIGGARLGALFGEVDPKVKKYVGLGILSQAGVAIGLSLMVRQDLALFAAEAPVAKALAAFRLDHPGLDPVLFDPLHIGAALLTTVTATCIVFEVVGPILTKFALTRAGEIPED